MYIKFNFAKMDKAKLKLAVLSLVDAANPAIEGMFAPVAQSLLKSVGTRVSEWIDGIGGPVTFNQTPGETLSQERYDAIAEVAENVFRGQDGFMASVPMGQSERYAFLSSFQGIPPANMQFASDNPVIIDKLNARDRKGRPVFSREQQAKILANMDWMQLLLEFAPIIVKLILLFI